MNYKHEIINLKTKKDLGASFKKIFNREEKESLDSGLEKSSAGFFEKMTGEQLPPEFLSTHPNPENRIEKIMEVWTELGSKDGEEYVERYQEFKASLP